MPIFSSAKTISFSSAPDTIPTGPRSRAPQDELARAREDAHRLFEASHEARVLRSHQGPHLFLAHRLAAAKQDRTEDARVVEAQVAFDVLAFADRDPARRQHVVEGRQVHGLAVHEHAVEVQERREHGPLLLSLAVQVERHDDRAPEARLDRVRDRGVALVSDGQRVRAGGDLDEKGVGVPQACAVDRDRGARRARGDRQQRGLDRRARDSRSASARSAGERSRCARYSSMAWAAPSASSSRSWQRAMFQSSLGGSARAVRGAKVADRRRRSAPP